MYATLLNHIVMEMNKFLMIIVFNIFFLEGYVESH